MRELAGGKRLAIRPPRSWAPSPWTHWAERQRVRAQRICCCGGPGAALARKICNTMLRGGAGSGTPGAVGSGGPTSDSATPAGRLSGAHVRTVGDAAPPLAGDGAAPALRCPGSAPLLGP
eukprot:TRINITY_DN7697_c0_g1_i14.p2 TRINITY_DN7697_c0_g1~~TRINITY_DN7697_c0_g1_i14.p2  ORF type:complete len:120 (+),score=8.78 TRINITY_DN7697_c0_g1_i14:341-700(+)